MCVCVFVLNRATIDDAEGLGGYVRCALWGAHQGLPRLAKAWSSHTQRLHECRERESGVLWGSMETRATKRDREVPVLSAKRDLVFQLSIDGFTRVSRGAMELAHIVQPPLARHTTRTAISSSYKPIRRWHSFPIFVATALLLPCTQGQLLLGVPPGKTHIQASIDFATACAPIHDPRPASSTVSTTFLPARSRGA